MTLCHVMFFVLTSFVLKHMRVLKILFSIYLFRSRARGLCGKTIDDSVYSRLTNFLLTLAFPHAVTCRHFFDIGYCLIQSRYIVVYMALL